MVDDCAGPFRQRNRGARAGDIGTEPGNEGMTARGKKLGRLGNGRLECCRLARDPRVRHGRIPRRT